MKPYMNVDLRPFLPETWREDLEKFATTNTFTVQQDEGGPGSIGYAEAGGIDYKTAMRPELIGEVPWLSYLHEQVIPTLLNLQGYGGLPDDPRAKGTLMPITTAHGISLNVYDPLKKGIEWHRDGADVFLNVILSTGVWVEGTGGRLMVHDGEKVNFVEFPEHGVAVMALTGDYPHCVEKIKDPEMFRLTVMFSYTNPERAGWREDAYNEHFYPGRDDE